jgi:formate C-acetyltransferase
MGFNDFIELIKERIDYFAQRNESEKVDELNGMKIAAEAMIKFAHRYADLLKSKALKEEDKTRRSELEEMAAICEHVPANPPGTFWEALQYYWFVHIGVITELNTWDSFNPGRLDLHLYPFFANDIQNGTLTLERAKELLQAFWIKFNNQPAPPKVGVTAQESNTYTDFALINLGGLNQDGGDAVNELTYIILDVIEEMRLLQPSSMVQVSKKNPDKFLKRALRIIKTGFGQPSIFNTDAIIQELLRQGKSIEDARNGGASGCVEAGAFGKESYILTGYFNLVKILELTLNNGWDPVANRQLGIESGNPNDFKSFDEFFDAFKSQLKHFIDIKLEGNRVIERIYADNMPSPFLSILIDDCIEKGLDYNCGGARYNTSYIQGVGLGTITDSLSAIKYHVFDLGTIKLNDLADILRVNFEGSETLRQKLLFDTPRYGNDNGYADDITKMVFDAFFDNVDGIPNTKGGRFRINLLPTTSHVYFGSVIGATPDGRKAFQPLSEGISPVQGADLNGPTAVIKSASKIDHIKTGGTLLNQKFSPQFLETDEGIAKLASLVRTYFKLDGHHIQFNVVDAETLKEAQQHPEQHRDLIVRVAGYSDYFVDLNEALQNEIIRRTEHLES